MSHYSDPWDNWCPDFPLSNTYGTYGTNNKDVKEVKEVKEKDSMEVEKNLETQTEEN